MNSQFVPKGLTNLLDQFRYQMNLTGLPYVIFNENFNPSMVNAASDIFDRCFNLKIGPKEENYWAFTKPGDFKYDGLYFGIVESPKANGEESKFVAQNTRTVYAYQDFNRTTKKRKDFLKEFANPIQEILNLDTKVWLSLFTGNIGLENPCTPVISDPYNWSADAPAVHLNLQMTPVEFAYVIKQINKQNTEPFSDLYQCYRNFWFDIHHDIRLLSQFAYPQSLETEGVTMEWRSKDPS